MKTKNQKGIIPISISAWGAGLFSAIILSYGGLTTATLFNHSGTNATQDSKIAVNETNIENMKEIMQEIKEGNEKIINLLMERK